MFQGSMVALVTPMTADEQLDWASLHKLVEWHIEKGTDAIVAVGTTGESSTLTVGEHIAVIKAVVEQVDGRIPVIAGTGANNTVEAIEMTRTAKEAGADACLLVTPYYNKPSQEGLYLHFKAIADAVDVPQILYNVPGRTGVDMLPNTVFRLQDHKNIVGIKEATGDLDRAKTLIEGRVDGFDIMSGDDETAVELILLGGTGNISVTANVAPSEVSQMCALALAGDADAARSVNRELNPVHHAMFVESNPIPVKWAVAEMGLMEGGIRLPMTQLDSQYHNVVRTALQNANLL